MIRKIFLISVVAVCSLRMEAASVFGRAIQKDGSDPSGPCRATLRAEGQRRGAPDTDLEVAPDDKTSFSVPLNRSGDFRFAGVPSSKYLLTVECASASALRELKLEPGKDLRINPPLLLEDLTLEVVITPRVDPNGRPWQLTVDATMPRLRRIATTANTSAEGDWARSGLVAGNYRVDISSSEGKPWLQRFFNLSKSSGPLQLSLPFIHVSGEVRLGTRPLAARLLFHNDAGGEPATLSSDANGFFQGLLPVTADAEKTNWTVEARAANPPISRRITGVSVQTLGESSAWLDLALPVFAVHGTVVSKSGKPQNGVEVTFEEITTGARSSTATGENGGFELEDLPAGKYSAVANSVEGVSERTAFQVLEGAETELKLILEPSERIPFYVVSSSGPVADAAVQIWLAPGVARSFTHTDTDGHFEAKLPPGTTEVGLTVEAQGYAVKLTRLQISQDSENRPDANTITLENSGGALLLDLQPPRQIAALGVSSNSSTTTYLTHNGAIEAIGTLVEWSSNETDAGGAAPLVEKIEPGVYSLCVVEDPAELSALWFGVSSGSRCRTGSVDEGETLTLSRP